MSLAQHLLELRRRLFISAIAVLIFSIGGFLISDFIWNALREPIITIAEAQNRQAIINYSTLTSGFDLRIQIGITVGVVVSSPVWLYQIFAYLLPGLTSKERRYTLGFVAAAIPLFAGGVAAGWYVIPHIVEILASFVPSSDASIVEASSYLGLVLKLLLAVGIAFVLPVFVVLLNFAGILSAKGILSGWRWAVLAIFVFCAIATPAADVASMFLLAAPMIVLYFLAGGIAVMHDRRAEKRLAATLAGTDSGGVDPLGQATA